MPVDYAPYGYGLILVLLGVLIWLHRRHQCHHKVRRGFQALANHPNPEGYHLSLKACSVSQTDEDGQAKLVVENRLSIPIKGANLRVPLPIGWESEAAEVALDGHPSSKVKQENRTLVIPLGNLLPKKHLHVTVPLKYSRINHAG